MSIHFSIHFITQWGESLHLVVHAINSAGELQESRFQLVCDTGFNWKADYTPSSGIRLIHYKYELVHSDKSIQRESGEFRKLILTQFTGDIQVIDYWRTPNGDSAFTSTVFSECYFKRSPLPSTINSLPVNLKDSLVLKLYCPQVESNYHLAVVGNQDCLGNWDVSKKVRLNETDFPLWSVTFESSEITFPLEYKYLLVNTETDEVLAWGGGPNRLVRSVDNQLTSIVTDEHFLRTIPSWRAAGVAIPVFSLRSKKGFGIGEFYDLKLMVDWAVLTGQKMIQTLPINDTILYHSNYDSYPYNAVSVYALHPVYLNLEAVGKLKDPERKTYFAAKKKELNLKSYSDYQLVMDLKWEYLSEIYKASGNKTFKTEDYKHFFDKNSTWLEPYAVFSYLRDKYGTPEFSTWPDYTTFDEERVRELASPRSECYQEVAFFYFLQYHLNKQLTEVHDYARSQGICIKGDIPIGVSPRSVDAWMEPEMFNTSKQAGAPPDDFSVTGQNWGFPTYNWERMEKDNYLWWKNRFRKLAEYFDAYRIDHILGFFRIWEIPEDAVWGLTGTFNPSLPLTTDELEAKGLQWDESRYLKPYLREHVLQAVFGKYTEEAIRVYFDQDGWQNYKFKEQFNTQKKVELHFASLGYNFAAKDVLIRDGLYQLHCEVLFLRDSRQPDKFHPRISMHSSATFRDLPDATRRLLDAIYVDYYYHRHNEFWKEQALKKLPALLSATNMLVCGEDLGMVPDSVPDVMRQLEILSLEIQRMPKKPHHEFAMPCDAPYLSVCTTSTHDMNPLRAWWLEDKALIQRFYNRALGMQGPAPENCEPWIAEKIIDQHLQSNAMWIILPWQDWMAIDDNYAHENPLSERINVPSNPRNFWCYRMHIHLEDLLKANEINQHILQMITASGRV
ncbi:MAG: 4-alpha-glucanotransferase [Paludibacter sp.]|nr:4-alpha-glucanotransferase [Paludibacter sp.]